MKKIFAIIFIASAFFSVSASAQTSKKGMGMAKQTLMDSLKISDATADSVLSIRQTSMTQMRTIMSDQSLSQDQKKEKAKPIKQEMKTRLQKFLDKDQLAKLQGMEMEMRQNKKNQ
ncbi:MAG: hypothetical protein ABI405_12000 [Parafilimonas sp.]